MEGLNEAQRQVELGKFPLWSGDKSKDQFTAEQWIRRIEAVAQDGAWQPARTMTHVLASLRGKALTWFESLARCNIDTNDFDAFKAAFLEAYSEVRTARTATFELMDLSQRPGEPVNEYHPRLIKILDTIEHFFPENFLRLAAPWPNEFTNLGGFAAVADAVKNRLQQRLLRQGAKQGLNSVGLLLFMAGLRPQLRDELMKDPPANLYAAFQKAQQLDRLYTEPAKKKVAAIEATEGDDEEDVDRMVEALETKLEALKTRRAQFGSSKFGRSGPSSGNRNFKNLKCHYCDKKGHLQKNCFKRQRDNAPMVDWRKKKTEETTMEMEMAGSFLESIPGAAVALKQQALNL